MVYAACQPWVALTGRSVSTSRACLENLSWEQLSRVWSVSCHAAGYSCSVNQIPHLGADPGLRPSHLPLTPNNHLQSAPSLPVGKPNEWLSIKMLIVGFFECDHSYHFSKRGYISNTRSMMKIGLSIFAAGRLKFRILMRSIIVIISLILDFILRHRWSVLFTRTLDLM